MYKGSKTSVKSICGTTEDFRLRVSFHHGSILSSYLVSVIMDEITKEIQEMRYHGVVDV